jgi:hypothetical protein
MANPATARVSSSSHTLEPLALHSAIELRYLVRARVPNEQTALLVSRPRLERKPWHPPGALTQQSTRLVLQGKRNARVGVTGELPLGGAAGVRDVGD